MGGYISFVPVENGTPVVASGVDPFPVTLETSKSSSLFSEVVTANRTPIIELNSSYGVTALRDVTTVTNGGSVTDNSTEGTIQLQTSATANGTAQLESAEAVRYIPGYGGQLGCGVLLPEAPTGNQVAEWGALTVDGNDGFLFGQDAAGVYVELRKNGTGTKVYQSSWNVDKLDGTGKSGATLDTSSGYIYQVEYSWYGYGIIRWSVLANVNNRQTVITVHEITPSGETSISRPNLVLHQKVDNGGDATNLVMQVGGRQYSIIGLYVPKFRFTSQTRAGVSTSTTLVPTVSFRTKTAFQDRSVRVQGYIANVSTEDCEVFVVLNGSLTGASYTTPSLHTASETAVETDVSATAISGGFVVWSDLVVAGQGNKSVFNSSDLDFDISQTQPVSLCIRTLSGTGSADVHFRLREEW